MPTTITATDDSGTASEPRYRVLRTTFPHPKAARVAHEPPFSSSSDPSIYQYGTRVLEAGEIVETRAWPNVGTMFPLNAVARQIFYYFQERQKSRLPVSPYGPHGELRLTDGLGGPAPRPVQPKPPRVDLTPRQAWPGM